MDKIYKITSPNGKLYIGRTKHFDARMNEHKCNALTKQLPNSLYRAIRKYGWDNMKREIICEIESSKAEVLEEEMIKLNDSVRRGYNDTYNGHGGGDMWVGRRDTDKYMDYVEKQRIERIGENNGMFGKTHTVEAKQLQKEKAKGRFSLPWFIDRNGEDDGTRMYNERCEKLRNRKLNTDSKGRFTKKG